ncbi:hypothetical protein RJ640_025359 [Escallonia rubra]|uniref:RING-type E3 ubiquitin transferase n=1 Tax=Escallonia rubra TaxID=112253 RepID=A0AA88QTM5_9ASTE|nr:hypothetical protein RJ640_025359 [Escallonia rubra]
MAPTAESNRQAEQLRQDGNNYFNKDRFGAAIDAYTEAYTLTNSFICFQSSVLVHGYRLNFELMFVFYWIFQAITLCPTVAVYWSNRALCHIRRNEWTKVEEDCRRAIQLDHNSFKVGTNNSVPL